ncbi:MAG: hypothetical protein P1V51_10750 [Deltaproteobacteria bacterium]|nr:hypothetical protein [Deltaproteobacteria bacterium]
MKKVWTKMAVTAVVAFALVAALGWATAAVAQEEAGVRYSDKTVIDFNDVTLEGELTKPEGAYLLDRKKTKFSSLIRLRDDFLSELQTSVDNL